jgi:hypothetical protein
LPSLTLLQCNTDESQWLAGAITLDRDARFWVSVDAATSGPLVVFPLLLPLKVASLDPFVVSKLVAISTWCVCLCFSYMSFRHTCSSRLSLLAVTPLLVAASTLSDPDYVGYNGEHMPVAILAIGWFGLMRALSKQNTGRGTCFLQGLLLGLLPYAKLQAVPMGVVLGVAFLFVCRRMGQRLAVMAGVVTPSAFVLIYVLSAGVAQHFWLSYVLTNCEYATLYSTASPLQRTTRLPFFVFEPRDSLCFFACQAILVMSVVFVAIHRVSRRRKIQRVVYVTAYAYLAASYYAVSQTGNFYTHYFLFLLHPLVMCSSLLLDESTCCAGATSRLLKSRCVLAYVDLGIVLPAFFGAWLGNSALDTIDHAPLRPWRSGVADVVDRYRGGDSVLVVWGWAPHYYVQTRLPQGTRYGHTQYQIVSGPHRKYHMDVFVKDVVSHKHVIFVDATDSSNKYYKEDRYRHERFDDVNDLVSKRFRFVECADGCRVYVSRELSAAN